MDFSAGKDVGLPFSSFQVVFRGGVAGYVVEAGVSWGDRVLLVK